MAAPMLTVQVIALDGEAENENETLSVSKVPNKSKSNTLTTTILCTIHENVMTCVH
jgi:hypothetical protein